MTRKIHQPTSSGTLANDFARGENVIARADSTLSRAQSAWSRAARIAEQSPVKTALILGTVVAIGFGAWKLSR